MRRQKNNHFELIFSLGSMPIVPSLLTALNIQLMDYPFDYITGGDLKARTDILLSNFTTFLKEENMKLSKDIDGTTDIYKDISNGLTFPADFNPKLPFENIYPTAKQKYNKLIRHLLLKINSVQSILMIYVENPQLPEDEEVNIGIIKDTLKTLNEGNPNKSFNFLYIKNDDSVKDISIKEICNSAYCVKLHFYKNFSELSVPRVEAQVLILALVDLRLKMTWRQRKIMWTQKLLNKLIDFREEHRI